MVYMETENCESGGLVGQGGGGGQYRILGIF